MITYLTRVVALYRNLPLMGSGLCTGINDLTSVTHLASLMLVPRGVLALPQIMSFSITRHHHGRHDDNSVRPSSTSHFGPLPIRAQSIARCCTT